jgi:hypothetical protein
LSKSLVPNPHAFGPLGSGSFPFLAVERTEIMLAKYGKILTQNFSKELNFRAEDNVPAG